MTYNNDAPKRPNYARSRSIRPQVRPTRPTRWDPEGTRNTRERVAWKEQRDRIRQAIYRANNPRPDYKAIFNTPPMPLLDESWAHYITYEAVDAMVADELAKMDFVDQQHQHISNLRGAPPKSRVRPDTFWATRLLWWLVKHERAPERAQFSLHAVESLCMTDWFIERVEALGGLVERGELDRRRQAGWDDLKRK